MKTSLPSALSTRATHGGDVFIKVDLHLIQRRTLDTNIEIVIGRGPAILLALLPSLRGVAGFRWPLFSSEGGSVGRGHDYGHADQAGGRQSL